MASTSTSSSSSSEYLDGKLDQINGSALESGGGESILISNGFDKCHIEIVSGSDLPLDIQGASIVSLGQPK